MRIDWDVPITMDDGLVLRADVFRPATDGRYPVILSYGPYAKGLAFQDGYPSAWQRMVGGAPRRHRRLEQPLPELGSGRSGEMGAARLRLRARRLARLRLLARLSSIISRRARPRISTTASNGPACSRGRTARSGSTASPTTASTSGTWRRCSRRTSPPCASGKGAADWYRDMTHHGGILCTFWANWYDMQVKTVQYGAGERGKRSRVHGELVCGPRPCPRQSSRRTAAISATTSAPIRSTTTTTGRARRSGRRSRRRSCPPPTGAGRPASARQFRGLRARAPKEKWLEAHGIEHWTHFYTDYGRELQLRFFDHFLQGKNNGWDKQPRVLLQVRHPTSMVRRARRERMAARAHEVDEALPRSRDGRSRGSARAGKAASVRRDGRRRHVPDAAAGAGDRDHRAVGARSCSSHRRPAMPISSWCCASSPATSRRSCSRARSIRTPRSARAGCAPRTASSTRSSRPRTGPHTARQEAAAQEGRGGRARHRDLADLDRGAGGLPHRPIIRGKDYVYPAAERGKLSNFKNELTGSAPFLHDDPRDRPPTVFARPACMRLRSTSPTCSCRHSAAVARCWNAKPASRNERYSSQRRARRSTGHSCPAVICGGVGGPPEASCKLSRPRP